MENGIQPVMNVGNGDGYGWGGGWFMWVIILFALMGNGGWGNNRGYDCAATFKAQGETQAAIYQSNDMQDIKRSLNGLGNGLADVGYALNSAILNQTNTLQRDVLAGNYGLDKSILQSANQIGAGIAENRFAQQQCCCQTQQAIQGVNYANAMNTTAIQRTITDEAEKTRAVIIGGQIQDLRDRLADRDRDLQTATFALSQCRQNAELIGAIRPFPVPAYNVQSPYTATAYCGFQA